MPPKSGTHLARASRTMRAVGLIVLIVLTALAALAIGAVLLLESERAEQWIEEQAARRLGRSVAIEGIDLRFAWPPRIGVEALAVGNPQWAHNPHLLDAEDLVITVKLGPLLRRRLVLERLEIARGTAGLERDGERATWRLYSGDGRAADSGSGGTGWSFALREARFGHALIDYRDEPKDTALRIEARGALGGGGLAAHASGRFRGEPAEAIASTPAVLLSLDQAIRLRVEGSVAQTSGRAEGTVHASVDGLRAIDAALELSGPNLARLRLITGVRFPATPPYRIEGRLVHEPGRWTFEKFDGRVGDSDLHGRWFYEDASGRPFIRADLRSKVLDFDDLGPLIGTPPDTGEGETASPRQAREAKRRAQDSGVLPDKPFLRGSWDAMNADVRYRAERIVHAPNVPLESLEVHAVLENGKLRLEPLALGVAGGRVAGSAFLDSAADPLHARIDLEARSLDLARFFPQLRSSEAALGSAYGRAKLEGRGNSVSALAATSDGDVALMVEDGSVNALFVEALGLDLGEALVLLGTQGKDRVPLRCAVADFVVRDGVAQVETFVVDTADTFVSITGAVYLGFERLDLVAHPQPRDASLLSARSPIVIGGSFKDPQVRPKASSLAPRLAAAGLLALVNPLLGLIPLIEPGTAPESHCVTLLQEAQAESR